MAQYRNNELRKKEQLGNLQPVLSKLLWKVVWSHEHIKKSYVYISVSGQTSALLDM